MKWLCLDGRRDRVSRRGKIDRGVEGLPSKKVLISTRIDATIFLPALLNATSHLRLLRCIEPRGTDKYPLIAIYLFI